MKAKASDLAFLVLTSAATSCLGYAIGHFRALGDIENVGNVPPYSEVVSSATTTQPEESTTQPADRVNMDVEEIGDHLLFAAYGQDFQLED